MARGLIAAAALWVALACTFCGGFAPGDAEAAVRTVATAGDPTPVGGTFSSSLPPHVLGVNDNAEVLFWSGLSGTAADAGLFLFSAGAIRTVAVHGGGSPIGGTFQLISLDTARLNAQGEVLFVAEVAGGRSPAAVFLWRRPALAANGVVTPVVVTGDPAPRPALIEPKRDEDIFLLDVNLGVDVNDNGIVALYAAQGKRSGVGGVSKSNLYLVIGGQTQRVLDAGTQTAAGTLNLGLALAPFVNNNNQMLLWTLGDADKQTIALCTTGACQKVVAQGDSIPGGTWPLATGPCCMLGFNDRGQVALSGLNPRGEVLIWNNGGITPLVRAGDPVADPAGSTLDSLSADEIHRRRQALNNLGELAFIGRLPDPLGPVKPGIFVVTQGAVRKVVLAGDPAPDAAGSFTDFDALALSDGGCLAFSGLTGPTFKQAAWIADFPAVPGQPARTCRSLTGRVIVDVARPPGPMKRNPSGFYSGDLPLRRVKLALENAAGTIVSEQFTQDSGRYSFPAVVGLHRLRLTLEDRDALIRIFDVNRDAVNVAFARTQLFQPPISGQQDFRLRIGAGGGTNTTFYDPPLDAGNPTNSTTDRFAHLAYAYHNAQFAAQVAKGLPVQRAERINVQSALPTSHRCPAHGMEISAADSVANNPDRDRPFADFHEYGHHVTCASPIAGVEDHPHTGDVGNHAGIANSTSSDAWGEGISSFFAAVDAEQGGDPQPHVLVWAGGSIMNLVAGGARLDDPRAAGYNPTFGALGEEWAIASVMWELHRRLGLFNRLWPVLNANTPDLETWKALYDAMKTFETANPTLFADLTGTRCTFNGNAVDGLDCLFVERGFYHDADGDGLYSAGESVGVTRWDGAPARGPAVRREDVPIIPGSTMQLRAVDALTLAPLDQVQLLVRILYDPPLEENNLEYPLPTEGAQPYAIPIVLPGNPSKAVLIAQRAGYADSEPLTIESGFFHERINPSRPGGVSPVLLEHTFKLTRLESADTIPPTTIATLSPPPNAQGWNNGPVTADFSATDNPGGSGVQQIKVELTGAQTDTVLVPGGTASVTITAEGTTTVTYSAMDQRGNQEERRTLSVRIDRSIPIITGMPAPGCTLWPPNKKLVTVARLSATDTLSGLATFTVTGASSEPSNPGSPDIVITGTDVDPRVVSLRADRNPKGPGRIYTITALATDAAGNLATTIGTCVVPHSAPHEHEHEKEKDKDRDRERDKQHDHNDDRDDRDDRR